MRGFDFFLLGIVVAIGGGIAGLLVAIVLVRLERRRPWWRS